MRAYLFMLEKATALLQAGLVHQRQQRRALGADTSCNRRQRLMRKRVGRERLPFLWPKNADKLPKSVE